MSEVSLGFVPEMLSLSLDQILFSRKPPSGLTSTFKFRQIRSSIEEVGLIEPLTVIPTQEKSSQHLLLDGHIRVIALRELGYTEVPCLVAKDDEAYTFNSRLNRLSTVQEHLMIRRAIDQGVAQESLAKALNVNMSTMKKKITLLDGICPEAAELLKDRQFTPDLSRILRKMKPTRQIACVELMRDANRMTVTYAEGLLATTPIELTVDGQKPKKMQGLTQEQMLRMESEMTNVQKQYKMIEHTFGQDTVQLVVARGYLVKILENKSVTKYLRQNKPEILEQFLSIIRTSSLEESSPPAELPLDVLEGA